MTARFIALDPGETTGWAKFDENGLELAYGQFKQDEQTEWLNKNVVEGIQAVIIEDYRNYAHKKQKNWSRNQTSKNIGAIELICQLRGIPYYLQGANVKTIGYLWSGLKGPPSDHTISHQFDAVAHGVYWLTTNGFRSPTHNNPEGEL